MISDRSTYEKEVLQPLLRLEQKKMGETFELYDGVIGFKTGRTPKILISGCHHASEIYGTYEAILNFIENTTHDVVVVPVVDVPNFCYYNDQSVKYLSDHYEESRKICFVLDIIRGYKGMKPEKIKWQYGDIGAAKIIKKMSQIIEDCDLIIDLHNMCANQYCLITCRTKKNNEQEYLENILKKISERDEIYTGALGVKFKKLSEGLFESRNSKTINAYASKKGIINLSLEVPVFSNLQVLRNFSELSEFNSFLLDYIISQYIITYGEKNETKNRRIW
jgi:hypothetical protein